MGVWECGNKVVEFKIIKLALSLKLLALSKKRIPTKNRRDFIAYDY
jgi:hypothetical protein